MSSSVEKSISGAYPNILPADDTVIAFHVFGIDEIGENLGKESRSLAHNIFNGASISCLQASELFYAYDDESQSADVRGITSTRQPYNAWLREQLSFNQILKRLESRIMNCDGLFRQIQIATVDQALLVSDDERGTFASISLIDGSYSDDVVFLLDFSLDYTYDTPGEKYSDFIEALALWGQIHGFIASEAEKDGMPVRYITNDPQHTIYVGGATNEPTRFERTVVTELDALANLSSEQEIPSIASDTDFLLLEEKTFDMSDSALVEAARSGIVIQRQLGKLGWNATLTTSSLAAEIDLVKRHRADIAEE